MNRMLMSEVITYLIKNYDKKMIPVFKETITRDSNFIFYSVELMVDDKELMAASRTIEKNNLNAYQLDKDYDGTIFLEVYTMLISESLDNQLLLFKSKHKK